MPKTASKKQTKPSRIMVQCSTAVNRDAVRRETIDGIEHIMVSSATLPDNIVMNGGLYPAEEIAKSFETLELTLAPVEHPNIDGQFISANDPRAIHSFHAGAFNMNVRRENGRVWVDKVINVAEARKSDLGKRLLDRVEELETNSNPRPIHTSVGVFVTPEELDEPATNATGDEYGWIARDMVFDHDAILLDSVGAAQPHQGVGVAVNRKGEEFRIERFEVSAVTASRRLPLAASDTTWDKGEADRRVRAAIGAEDEPNATYGRYHLWFDANNAGEFGAYKLPFVDIIDGEARAVPAALRNAAARLSQTQGPSAAEKERIQGIIDGYLNELRDNADDEPQTNSEGDAMKELMLKALADAGIQVNADASDEEVLAAYSKLSANQSDSDGSGADDKGTVAEVVANAMKPFADQLASMEAKLNSAEDAELNRLAELVGNSDKFPGLDAEGAKKLGVDTLKSMAANCAIAYGVSPVVNRTPAASESHSAPSAMPE